MDSKYIETLKSNITAIRENISRAADSCGRSPGGILLCAACKTRTIEEVRASAAMDIDVDVHGKITGLF